MKNPKYIAISAHSWSLFIISSPKLFVATKKEIMVAIPNNGVKYKGGNNL